MFKTSKSKMDQPSYKTAVARYRKASGDLFIEPSKQKSSYQRGAWVLHDAGGLICVVDADNVVFGANLAGAFIQLAEGFQK